MPSKDKYQDEHRIFVQGLMCKGILDEKEVHSLHKKALRLCNIPIPETKSEKNRLLVENIQIINNELKKVGLLIKKGQDEDSGKSFFLLANTQSRITGSSKELATSVQGHWSSQELEYLRLIATEILESEAKDISPTAALRLTDKVDKKAGKKLSMEAAEKTINSLVEAKWIKVTSSNKLALDVRFLGEMESWMVEVMGRERVHNCETCRKLVVRGGACSCQPDLLWHFHCLDRQANKGADIKCAVCQKKVSRAEGARKHQDQDDEDEDEDDVSQRPKRRSFGRNARSQLLQEIDDVEEEDQRPRSNRKSSGRKARYHQKMEEEEPRPGPSRGEPSKRSRKTDMMEVDEEEGPSQVSRSRIKRRCSGEDDSD